LSKRSFLSAWIPVFVWLGVIAFESTQGMGSVHTAGMLAACFAALHIHVDTQQLEKINHALRKAGHFCGYGILCVVFFRAWQMTIPLTKLMRVLALALFCTLLVASADEIHQSFLPGRTASPLDVLLDLTGALLLTSAAMPLLRRTAQ
jgi:VanZ family protein